MARQPWRVTRPLVFVLSFILVLEAMWIAPAPAVALPAAPAPQTDAPLASPLVIPDTTLRVSESSDGDQGDGLSGTAYVSADGRYVAFHAQAATLVDGDTNGVTDVFVRDMLTGETTRVSVSSAGAEGNGNSQEPSISGDGRYVVFQSVATNLVSGDSNAKRDIFVHDRATATTERVSIDTAGGDPNNTSGEPVLSFDGRYVAFSSSASDLVASDTNAKADIFLHDRTTDATTRVSVDSSGAQANGESIAIALSDDASIVAFDSAATNLVSGDTNAKRDIFVRDVAAGTTVRVSVDSSEAQANGHHDNPSISGDGRYVAFDSVSTNLGSGDSNGEEDVFVRDTVAGTTERVSIDSAEAQANNGSQRPSISDDGRWVTFNSVATNLVASDTNAVRDVFLRDRTDGTTERISLGYDGTQGNGISVHSELAAADGRSVVFKSSATNLVVGDTNALDDVFIRQAADRTDETNLGLQPQHSVESWDLGAGDALSVNVGNGNLVLSHPIVSLPIEGSALSVELTYNSHDAANVGLGRGWRLNLERRLTLNDDGSVTFVDSTGGRHTFTAPVTAGSVTTYTRPERLYATLVKDTGASPEFTLVYRHQSVDEFDIAGSQALLVRAEDRFGNGVDLAYGGATANLSTVTDAASRQLTFSWDTAPAIDRLTSFTDWAYISGGVVQTSASGALRSYRFFYDGDGRLAGWSDPLNTAGSCPTGGSHLTCLAYSAGLLSALAKTQTVTTFSAGALGTTTRAITTNIAHAVGRVASVTDAEQVALSGPATTFTLETPTEVVVDRPTTTTRYELLAAHDRFARVASSFRVYDVSTEIERATTWDTEFPIEPASVTDNVGAELDAPARTVTYDYVADSLGLLAKLVEPLDASTDRWTEHTYNANNDVTQTIVSEEGSGSERTTTRFCYDAGCTLTGAGLAMLEQVDNYVSGGDVDDDTNVSTEYTSDAHGQVTSVSRHNRDATEAVLDDREDVFTFEADTGNLIDEIVNYDDGAVTDPGDDVTPDATTGARTDLTTTHAYDTAGNRVSTADSRRAVEDALGTTLGADDFITRWTYDALNQQLSEETPTTPGLASTQATATSAYDELGLLRTASDFGDLVTATEFDRAGRSLRTFEDAAASAAVDTALTTFDADGRALTVKDRGQLDDAGLGVTTYAYDALGRAESVTDADGAGAESLTEMDVDGLDRQIRLEVGVGATSSLVTLTAHDLGGRTIATDDGFTCGLATFDYRDRPLTTTSGLSGGACDPAADDRTLTHTHDGLGRLTRTEVTDGADLGDRTVDDVFDAVGNRRSAATEVASVAETTDFAVNLLDQVTAEERADGSTAKTNYDPAGNPTDRCFWTAGATVSACDDEAAYPWSDPPTQVSWTAYDARNQRVSLVDPVAGSVTLYDPDHNYAPAAVYRATASSREHQALYAYDDQHRLEEITFQTCTANGAHACTDSPVATGSNDYTYDLNHNRTQVEEDNGATATDFRYCYDARNQLEYRNTGSACSSTAKDEAWTYDDAGNRLTAMAGGTQTNFGYDGAGLLCDIEIHPTGTACAGNVAHDSAGRISEWNSWFFIYDAEGRLTAACKSSTCASGHDKVEFTYDGEGHRTSIVATAANSTVTTTEFAYQGDAVVEERVNGTVMRRFVTDESGSISKLIIPSGANAGTYLVIWNGHGDALNLLRVKGDGTTELANSFSYSTWGTPAVDGTHDNSANSNADYGDLGFRYLYVGQYDVQWDDPFSIGLHYMHFRHYAPTLGRFLQTDPSRLESNAHGYVQNNPMSFADPSGTCGGGGLGPGPLKKYGNCGGAAILAAGLRALFKYSLRFRCITSIASTLANYGWRRSGVLSGYGYLWTNGLGDEVRVRVVDGQWYARVRNRYGNYLSDRGAIPRNLSSAAYQAATHIPVRRC